MEVAAASRQILPFRNRCVFSIVDPEELWQFFLPPQFLLFALVIDLLCRSPHPSGTFFPPIPYGVSSLFMGCQVNCSFPAPPGGSLYPLAFLYFSDSLRWPKGISVPPLPMEMFYLFSVFDMTFPGIDDNQFFDVSPPMGRPPKSSPFSRPRLQTSPYIGIEPKLPPPL